jgi:hypothetical protein
MTGSISFRHAAGAGLAAALLLTGAALAHHGWSWAEDEQTELTGTIREIYIGPPHPALEVETADDGIWTIELANPRATERSGFVKGSASEGDEVVVLGHRSLDANEKRMKAVRITVEGKQFDLYPDRIRLS